VEREGFDGDPRGHPARCRRPRAQAGLPAAPLGLLTAGEAQQALALHHSPPERRPLSGRPSSVGGIDAIGERSGDIVGGTA
jgi:hypothetical protein